MILKKYGYSISDILSQNLIVTSLDFGLGFLFIYLAYRFNPMKILRVLSSIFVPGVIVMIFLVYLFPSPKTIFAFQIFTLCLCPNTMPAEPIIFQYFPLFKRFRAVATTYALATALVYVVSSFGVELIVNYTNFLGLLALVIPFSAFYLWGLNNFIRAEKKKGEYSTFF